MGLLDNIEPKKVMYFFEEITKIPHGSKNEGLLAKYLINFSKSHNLKYISDTNNNVIIIKEATKNYENSEPIILQAHIDMVCEKTKESCHDFTKDPLKLCLNDNILKAKDTTLGADNGIAVAMFLSILDSDDIPHPKLECVFTSAEEIGMIGAKSIDVSMLTGKKLLNLDSGGEGVFTVGCSGGLKAISCIPLHYKTTSGQIININVSGLQGGHSGMMINKERLNASILMGRILFELRKFNYKLIDINGGTVDNAITKECNSKIICNVNDIEKIINAVNKINNTIAYECRITDPNVKITTNLLETGNVKALDEDSTVAVYSILMNYPQGVYSMSMEIKDLVESSLNMGVIKIEDDNLIIKTGIRSSSETKLYHLADKIDSLVSIFGGKTQISDFYPGWEYNPKSKLRENVLEAYKKLYNKEPIVLAIHAGLECGLFSKKISGLDCVSMGPNMNYVHTPDEQLDLKSVERTWILLKEILKLSK